MGVCLLFQVPESARQIFSAPSVPSRANMIDIDSTEDQDSTEPLHNLLPSTRTRHNFVLPRAKTIFFFNKKIQKQALF